MAHKKSHIWLTLFAAAAIAVIASITAFFTETEYSANTFTVGKVDISLEEDYETTLLRPNEKVKKNPSVKNAGSTASYVFLEVDVPKAEITLLDDNGQILTEKSVQEIFNLISKATTHKTVTSNFTYDKDWIYLINETITSKTEYNTYIFAYSKKLGANKTTSELFDEIQLRKFIDSEYPYVTSGQNKGKSIAEIDVRAFAIQADNLEGMIYSDDTTKNFYYELYGIIKKREE